MTHRERPTLYRDCAVALLTRHHKRALLAPPLEAATGCVVTATDAYDTDLLGSFSRSVERLDSPLHAARRKACIGASLLGADVGLASEGSFGPDPVGGLMPWNVELVVWVDVARGWEVVGMAQGPARHQQARLSTLEDLRAWAVGADFPAHGLMLRPDRDDDPRVVSGILTWPALEAAFARCAAHSDGGAVVVEHDLRAFANPTRQRLIRAAADDLAARLSRACPACGAPGWSVVGRTPGLPCGGCGRPTRAPRLERWRCAACGHAEETPVAGSDWADPSRCDACNP